MSIFKYASGAVLFLAMCQTAFAQQKRPMEHTDYAGWKNITPYGLTRDGSRVGYGITPQRGDGVFYFSRTDGTEKDSLQRATMAQFGASGGYIAAMVKAPFEVTRKMKIDKKKPDDMPKDTLVIKVFGQDSLRRYAPVVSYKKGRESDWLAFTWDKVKPAPVKDTSAKKDTLKSKEAVAAAVKNEQEPAQAVKTAEAVKDSVKKKPVEKKSDGKKLTIANPLTGRTLDYEHVVEYAVSDKSDVMAFVVTEKDSVETSRVYRFDPAVMDSAMQVFSAKGKAVKIALSEDGRNMAFMHSQDTAKVKIYDLYLLSGKDKQAVNMERIYGHLLTDSSTVVSEYFAPSFSRSGNRLYFGVGARPEKETKDTLLAEEKARFDLWSWTDDALQPQQLIEATREKTRSYRCVYTIGDKKAVRLADENIRTVSVGNFGDAATALGFDDSRYRLENSFGYSPCADVYLIDVRTGARTLMAEKTKNSPSLSPAGKYMYYFDSSDSSYYAMDVAKKHLVNMTSALDSIAFYNEDMDMPMDAYPYGWAGWSEGDKVFYVYDKYDIWALDPSGKADPVNVTATGRRDGISLRNVNLDADKRFFSIGDTLLLQAFDNKTKENGFYSLVLGNGSPASRITMDKKMYTTPVKAKKAQSYLFRKGDFNHFPELYFTENMDFAGGKCLTHANPQMDSILWGTAELVRWNALDGQQLEGILYKPENFDPSKKYPMIVYFYEKYSSDLYRFYTPAPSYSTVNFPYFVSNGYLVFVPDITYKAGYPGRCAENAIISGTLAMIDKGFVDPKAIGIQGQSWGGYQTAYLITQTDLFAAAGAGAPVSNMTSAYGGVRWESGRSRAPQYEIGQSRIGGTLWERPIQYIENSPLFYAPKVNTPLFIMHNDNDGAVPWYQGIEYFSALRRLGKPVWMINYNGDSHNLRPSSWGNRMDLSMRLGQFFGHYLKGEPMPQWMKDGIPAVKKGKTMGYYPAE